jgi:hypothetical protein
MVQAAKIALSEQEKQLMYNSDWILTKRSVTGKVLMLMNNVLIVFKQIVAENKSSLPIELYTCSPKISKGESYLSLPYVLLDYPKFFDKKAVFAIRTMFWWGNFFSCTLHLSGHYKYQFEENIIQNIDSEIFDNFYLCINEDQWQHHFERDNYKKLTDFTKNELRILIKKQSFIKIAFLCDLQVWDTLPQLLPKFFKELLALIF